MKNKDKKKNKRPTDRAVDLTKFKEPKTDPDGSWTGVPDNPKEKPVQDADDL